MINNETERALHELKLPGMASCWSSLEETHQLDKLTLREGMQIMLQHERDTRGNNRIQRLIKNAGFRLKASMEELETDTARGYTGLLCDRPCNRKLHHGRNDGHHYRTGWDRKVLLRLCLG